jgi:hypothetical protein
VHEQAERLVGRPYAEVEGEGVGVGESGIGQVGEVADVLVVDLGDDRGNVFAVVVPGGGDGMALAVKIVFVSEKGGSFLKRSLGKTSLLAG